MGPGANRRGSPPLILLHGIGANRCSWEAVSAGLPEGHLSIAVDLPGHGARADERFDLVSAMRVVVDVVSRQGGPVILVGWSLGGYVALNYASRWPKDVVGIVLIGSSMIPNIAVRVAFKAAALMARPAEMAAVRRLIARTARRRYGRRAVDRTLQCGIQPGNGLRALGVFAGWDVRRWLGRVRCHVLIVNGAHDRLFRWQERRIAGCLRHADVRTVDGVGHLAPLTAPGEVGPVIGEFVAGLPDVRTR